MRDERDSSGGVVRGEALVGNVEGCTAIILDDLISTGGTVAHAARACKAHGAANAFAAATHGLFIAGAAELIGEPAVDKIVVTDTVPPFRLAPDTIGTKVQVLEISPLIAQAVRRIHTGGSLVDLLG